MITLTTRLVMPDLIRLRLRKPTLDDDAGEVGFICDVVAQGGFLVASFALVLRDGVCTGLRVNASPTAYDDRLQGFTMTVANGYTQARAAFRAQSATNALQLQALETLVVSLGLLPAGTVS